VVSRSLLAETPSYHKPRRMHPPLSVIRLCLRLQHPPDPSPIYPQIPPKNQKNKMLR
jgi:hypothetical protein